jgi:tRNA A-37 threonylcarbamoyl transferase component Bud32
MSRETDPVLSGMSGKVADYRLDGYIGQGAAAVVYLAQDERSGRNVALKVLAPELTRDDAFRDQFLHEARAAADLDHPHIIPVYQAGEADGNLYLAMHYVQGGDARSLLNRFGPLPFAWAWTIIAQVASALDAAHAHGLIHRDVKPSNMLLDAGRGAGERAPRRADGGDVDHVYLSDFGMSTKVPPGDAAATGQYGGALDYVAPEQIEGRAVDGRADIYALASAGFELLCGTPPFGQDQGLTVMYAQMYAPPPSATARRPELPAAVDQVLATALAKNPAERYTTCGQFADELHAALGLGPGEQEPAAYEAGPAGHGTRPTAYNLGPAGPANGHDPGTAGHDAGTAAFDFEPPGPDPGTAAYDLEPPGPDPGTAAYDLEPPGPDPGTAAFELEPAGPDRGPTGHDPRLTAYDVGPAGPTGAYDFGPAGPTGAYDVGPAVYRPGAAAHDPRPVGDDPEPREPGYEPASAPVMSGSGWPPPPQENPTARIGSADEDPMEWPDSLFRQPQAQPPPPRPGRRLILGVAAATILVVAVIVGVLLMHGSSPGKPSSSASGPAASSAPPAASTTAARQAAAVNTLLGSSAVTRKALVSAITQVQSCAQLSAAVSQIQRVVNQRSTEVSRASAMSTAALANGATVKSDLLTALRNSQQADRNYLTWAQQQLARCRPRAPSAAYNAAISADQQADAAKVTFVRVWNPVAAKYGLPVATTSSF